MTTNDTTISIMLQQVLNNQAADRQHLSQQLSEIGVKCQATYGRNSQLDTTMHNKRPPFDQRLHDNQSHLEKRIEDLTRILCSSEGGR